MKSKRLLILIGLTAVFLAGCSGAPQSTGMDTPEKTVSAYVASITAGDFNAALTLCPAETMMKKFQSEEYSKTMVISGKTQSVAEIQSEYTLQTANLAISLLQSEITAPKAGAAKDAAWTEQFLKDNGAKLKDLQALRIDKPYKTGYNLEVDSDVYQESVKTSKASWGSDAYTERIALLQHNGKTYLAGFTLVEYGGAWGIKSVTSAFAEITDGSATQIAQEDYLKHIKPSATASK